MSQIIVFPIKDPAETKNYLFDFSDDMEIGETIIMASATVNYVKGSGDLGFASHAEGDPLLIPNRRWDDDDDDDDDGHHRGGIVTTVQQAFSGGTHLSVYDLRIAATTSKNQVLVRVGRISVLSRI